MGVNAITTTTPPRLRTRTTGLSRARQSVIIAEPPATSKLWGNDQRKGVEKCYVWLRDLIEQLQAFLQSLCSSDQVASNAKPVAIKTPDIDEEIKTLAEQFILILVNANNEISDDQIVENVKNWQSNTKYLLNESNALRNNALKKLVDIIKSQLMLKLETILTTEDILKKLDHLRTATGITENSPSFFEYDIKQTIKKYCLNNLEINNANSLEINNAIERCNSTIECDDQNQLSSYTKDDEKYAKQALSTSANFDQDCIYKRLYFTDRAYHCQFGELIPGSTNGKDRKIKFLTFCNNINMSEENISILSHHIAPANNCAAIWSFKKQHNPNIYAANLSTATESCTVTYDNKGNIYFTTVNTFEPINVMLMNKDQEPLSDEIPLKKGGEIKETITKKLVLQTGQVTIESIIIKTENLFSALSDETPS